MIEAFVVRILQVRCWEVQQSGNIQLKAQQTHTGPVLAADWSDVSTPTLSFTLTVANIQLYNEDVNMPIYWSDLFFYLL